MQSFARHSRARRAFTLIELLVVIAIIAILAAILFPVFAQAREKARQATCLSNEKQQGLAILQYQQDFDECFPLTIAVIGQVYNTTNWPVPYNWRSAYQAGTYRYEAARTTWGNSTQPYMKSYGVMMCPSAQQMDLVTADYATEVTLPQYTSYTMNGFLNQFPLGKVKSPSTVPMLWEGRGKAGYKGFYLENPLMNCDTTNPCIYVPRPVESDCTCDSSPQGQNMGSNNMFGMAGPVWTHQQGQDYLYCDGHVKYVVGLGQTGTTDYTKDPYTGYPTSGGIATSVWFCCGGGFLFSPTKDASDPY